MSNYATVVSRGSMKYVKCPFHGGGNERTPSCRLFDDTSSYYCYGCHASGNMFNLVMEKEGVDFPTAVEILAKRAGISVEYTGSEGEQKHISDEKNMLYELYDRLSSKTFHSLLLDSKEAQDARDYLKRRNVSDEMVEKFELGYAPKGERWLYSFLLSKHYSKEFLAKSGLFSKNYEGYSLFSNRLIFPIRDRMGRTIAFSGRDLSGVARGKYINSPETLIYQKKDNFYGMFEAKKTIASGTIAPILCEGNFDVVAMHQAGFTSAIASLGTAFTKEQCDSLVKWFPKVKEISLLFDSDDAGQRETEKAILLVQSRGLKAYVHRFKTAKDASELLERDGKDGVEREFLEKMDGFDYLVQKGRNLYDISDARGKSDFIRYLSPFVLSSTSSVERDGYVLKLSSMLATNEDSIWKDLKPKENPQQELIETPFVVDSESEKNTYDYFAMLFLACNTGLFKSYRNRLKFGDLEDKRAKTIYIALENAMRNDIKTPELFLSTITDEKTRNEVASSIAQKKYESANTKALDEAIMHIEIRSLEKQRDLLTSQLMLLPDSAGSDETLDLLEKKNEIDRNIKRLREVISNNLG